jgi:hypothetical protein
LSLAKSHFHGIPYFSQIKLCRDKPHVSIRYFTQNVHFFETKRILPIFSRMPFVKPNGIPALHAH